MEPSAETGREIITVTRSEVLAMLRDQPEETADMKILQDMSLEVLNSETVHAYRNRHMAYRTEHVWERLSDKDI